MVNDTDSFETYKPLLKRLSVEKMLPFSLEWFNYTSYLKMFLTSHVHSSMFMFTLRPISSTMTDEQTNL